MDIMRVVSTDKQPLMEHDVDCQDKASRMGQLMETIMKLASGVKLWERHRPDSRWCPLHVLTVVCVRRSVLTIFTEMISCSVGVDPC